MHQPLIILGPPRSFTSVGCAMLGQHPEMYGLPEVHLFTTDTVGELFYFYQIAGKRRQHGLLRAIAEVYLTKQTPQTVEMAKRWLIKNKDLSTAEVFHRLADKIAPKVMVEKSVSTIWRPRSLERVLETFPEARFLHLTRHPRAQCESMLEAMENEPQLQRHMQDNSTTPPTQDPQILWYMLHNNIVEFLKKVPEERKFRMRGEDLLTDPDTGLTKIVQWLGLRSDAEAIEAMKHPEQSPFSVMGPANAPFGNDPKFLKDPALRPARAKPQSLDGPLSWRSDIPGFSTQVRDLAQHFGYQ